MASGRNGRAHESFLQREHKQPVEEDVDDRRDRGAHAYEHGRTVVAAVVVHERHQPRRHREKRIPEQVVAHEPMIGLVCAEQRCDLRRETRADERHNDRGRQRAGKRVHERLICAGNVPAANAHGRDRHAADDREHDDGVEHHHKRPDQIARAERVRTDALPDKNAVDDRKEKISAVAENRRHDILRELFLSAVHEPLRAHNLPLNAQTSGRMHAHGASRPEICPYYSGLPSRCQAGRPPAQVRQKPLESLVSICYYYSM